ncbi:hypothetical protein [Vibrio sp. TRT 17S01]|uniref:hypothetical protein n=1 Tax=Vibrio sp. TRT 17S01 TaxID=3418505 RepID=UPI003CE9CE05
MKIVGWILAAFVAVNAFGFFVGGEYKNGLVLLIATIIAIPPFWAYTDRSREKHGIGGPLNRKYFIGIVFVIYALAIAFQPNEKEMIQELDQQVVNNQEEKDLGIEPGEFSTYVDMFRQENQLPRWMEPPYEFEIQEGDVRDTFQYSPRPAISVTGALNKGTGKIHTIFLSIQPNGSEKNIADGILVFSAILNSIDIKSGKEAHGDLIMRSFQSLMEGGSFEERMQNYVVGGTIDDQVGILIVFNPA